MKKDNIYAIIRNQSSAVTYGTLGISFRTSKLRVAKLSTHMMPMQVRSDVASRLMKKLTQESMTNIMHGM